MKRIKCIIIPYLRLSPFSAQFSAKISQIILYLLVSLNASAGINEEIPFDSIPHLPCVSPAELQERVSLDLARTPELVELNKIATERNIKLFLLGDTATDLIHQSRIEIMKKSQGEDLSKPLSLEQIFHLGQILQFGVFAESHSIISPQERHQIKQILQSVVSFPIKLIAFPSSLEKPFIDPNSLPGFERMTLPLQSNTFSGATVALEGGIVGDQTSKQGTYPAFFEALAQGQMDLRMAVPDLAREVRLSRRPPVLNSLHFLKQVLKYGLELDPLLLKQIRDAFQELNPNSLDPGTVETLHQSGATLFQETLDIEDAWNVLEYVGARKLYRRSDVQKQGSFSFFLYKEPLRSIPYPGQTKIDQLNLLGHLREAGELDLNFINHCTQKKPYQMITSHPAGKVNAFISRGMYSYGTNLYLDEEAIHGNGFYTTVGTIGNHNYGPEIALMELSPSAKQNIHFVTIPAINACRLTSSDPKFVRIPQQKRTPLYRPHFLSPLLTDKVAPEVGNSYFEKVLLRGVARLKK